MTEAPAYPEVNEPESVLQGKQIKHSLNSQNHKMLLLF